MLSSVSSQLLYTSAPLSLLLLLNLVNRRRVDRLIERNAAIAIRGVDLQLSKHIELLNQQVMMLPTPETIGTVRRSLLIKNRQSLEKLTKDIEVLREEMQLRIGPLEEETSRANRRDVVQLQQQYTQLCASIANLTSRIQQLAAADKVVLLDEAIARLQAEADEIRTDLQALTKQTRPTLTALQEQINRLNHKFHKLPPPFDATGMRQEVEELIRVVADLVPKRDWHNLVMEMKLLRQRQESQYEFEETLRQRLQELQQQIQAQPHESNLMALQEQIEHLRQQVQQLPPVFDPIYLRQEITQLLETLPDRLSQQDWAGLMHQIKVLEEQQQTQFQVEADLQRELEQMSQQLTVLLSKSGESMLQSAAESNQAEAADALDALQSELQNRLNQLLQQESREIEARSPALFSELQSPERLDTTWARDTEAVLLSPSAPPPQIEFSLPEMQQMARQEMQLSQVWSHDAEFQEIGAQGIETTETIETTLITSRTVLEEALDQTQQRLILILPWSSQSDLDKELLHKMKQLLDRGARLDLGWCYQSYREERFLTAINQRWQINPRPTHLAQTLKQLLELKQSYSGQFQFKILGTPENFLVSDQTYAVLGTDESLTTHTNFPELALKLRTFEPAVIQQLSQRFDQPDLQPSEVAAYWNRAVTRFDLGDRQGAIADFNQVLSILPEDAVAYNYRGLVQADLGDRVAAIADFSRSIALQSQQLMAYCNRGFLLSEAGDYAGAIADLTMAIQAQPNTAIPYFYRGLAHQKLNDLAAALTDFRAAIRRAPKFAPSYYYAGLCCQKLDKLQLAIANLEMAAELFTQQESIVNAQRAWKHLEKLRGEVMATPTRSSLILPMVVAIAPEVQPTLNPLPASERLLSAASYAWSEAESSTEWADEPLSNLVAESILKTMQTSDLMPWEET